MSLSSLQTWLSTEFGSAIIILLMVGAAVMFFRSDFGKVAGLFAIAGLMWFLSDNPEKVLTAIGNVIGKVFGG